MNKIIGWGITPEEGEYIILKAGESYKGKIFKTTKQIIKHFGKQFALISEVYTNGKENFISNGIIIVEKLKPRYI